MASSTAARLGYAGLDQGSFTCPRPGYGRHPPHLHRWYDHSLGRQLPSERVRQYIVHISLLHTAQQYGQPLGFLNQLPPASGYGVHNAVEQGRLHGNPVPGPSWKMQHVLDAPLYPVDKCERAPARAVGGGGRTYAVAHLVADQGHGAGKEDRDEHLLTVDARRDGSIVLVHNLGNNQILEEVHASVQVALGGYPRGLGRCVHVERLLAPRRLSVPPRPVRQHFRGAEDELGGDVKTSGELLFGQEADHRGIGHQHLWLPTVEPLDDTLQWIPRVQAQGWHPETLHRSTDPSGLVPGRGRAHHCHFGTVGQASPRARPVERAVVGGKNGSPLSEVPEKQAPPARTARGGGDPITSTEALVPAQSGQVRLDVRQAYRRVRYQLVEVFHHQSFGQNRKLLEGAVGQARVEPLVEGRASIGVFA